VEEDLAVYRTLRKVESIAVPPRTSLLGAVVRYRFSTDRPDIDPESRLSAEPVTGVIALTR
jgi:hypothetical protein